MTTNYLTMKAKLIFLFLLILFCQLALAQTNRVDSLSIVLKEQLQLLSVYPHQATEKDNVRTLAAFNPDSLVSVIKEEIVELFSIDPVRCSKEYFAIHPSNSDFLIMDLGYNTSGTAAYIPSPIIIKGNKIFTLTETECSFDQLYHLKDEIYLGIGAVPRPAMWCYNQIACVIDFSQPNGEIKPVFNGEKFFSLCNAEFSFNSENKILKVESDIMHEVTGDCNEYFDWIKDIAEISCITNYEEDLGIDLITVSLKFRFDGEKIIKP